MALKQDEFIRFLNKVDLSLEGCWNWKGCTNNRGYGWFQTGKTSLAHRISYKLFYGISPKNKLVLHKCDNPKCVNPDHLFLGTHKDNMIDMVNKGRDGKINRINLPILGQKTRFKLGQLVGEKAPKAKLNWDTIKLIREQLLKGITHKVLGDRFKVNESTISKIKRNLIWVE